MNSTSLKLTLILQLLILFAIAVFLTNQASIKSRFLRSNDGEASLSPATDAAFRGYIVSSSDRRYNHSQSVLLDLDITPSRYHPLPPNSTAVHDALLLEHPNSRTSKCQKVVSNRLAFTALFREFVTDPAAPLASWRFFFEDDITLHPFLTPSLAREVLSRGLEVAAGDGVVYLGICGAKNCQERVVLASPVEARHCTGACSHAFGVTKWKAGGVLAFLEKLEAKRAGKRAGMCLYFDEVLQAFGEQVHRVWVLGSNLWSPQKGSHWGMVFQDRRKFPSGMDRETSEEER